MTDVERVAVVLHRYGALSCWDYAAAGPYLPIDMNLCPEIPDGHLAYKDAVFLSPHKFIGGPETPGVLVAKRSLFRNRVQSLISDLEIASAHVLGLIALNYNKKREQSRVALEDEF